MNSAAVQRVLETLGSAYALIGAHAMAVRGYPRFTVDIDILTTDERVLDTSTWNTLRRDGAAVETRRGDPDDPLAGVVHILLPDGTDVDLVVARWKWEARLIDRSEPMPILGTVIRVPRMSDLILLKMAAGGFGDLQDAAALLAIGDADVTIREVEAYLDEVRPDVHTTWRALLAAHGD